MTHLVIWPPRCSRDYFNFCLSIIRDKHRRPALMALVNVVAKFKLLRLQYRAYISLEAMCTKINWLLVSPLTVVLNWVMNRYFPLPGGDRYIDYCARRERFKLKVISLYSKVSDLGKPFREIAFFFLKRRYKLAHIEQLLTQELQSLSKICNHSNGICARPGKIDSSLGQVEHSVDAVNEVHERPSLSGEFGDYQNSRECASRPLREGQE